MNWKCYSRFKKNGITSIEIDFIKLNLYMPITYPVLSCPQ